MLSVAETTTASARAGGTRPPPSAWLMITKANSPPAPSIRPLSSAAPPFRPNSRPSPAPAAVFSTSMPPAIPSTRAGEAISSEMFSPRPTDRKNRPSSRSLNGPISTSISCRYSVSASRIPATKAPSAMDRPSSLALSPAPITTSRLAAMNRSWLLARAADLNNGRNTRRPATMMPTRPMDAVSKASIGSGPPAWAPSRARATRIGATARSWNSRMENTARPEWACSRPVSAITGTARAVDDMVSAAPVDRAATSGRPAATATAPIRTPQPMVCRAPRPNTWWRISRSRSQDSSRPMVNNRKTTPSSAKSAICSGLETVK